MNNGTNNYGLFKTDPAEEIVGKTLQTSYRSYSNVIWRTGKPALDYEWNLLNDMSNDGFSNLVKSNTPSGWLSLGKNKFSTNCGISNTIVFYSQENENEAVIPNAFVNGWPILVGGVNYLDTTANQITLQPAGSSERFDFVFLEVWRAQVRSRDYNNIPIAQNKPSTGTIYKFGNTQFGGTNLPDDLIDPVFDEETSERVQVQYRIRVVSNVLFANTETTGFESVLVQGQGAGLAPQSAGYVFTNMKNELGDIGLWRAGNGNEASQLALQSVDGYSYAIPMFKIYRRSTAAYSDTGGDSVAAANNQKGNVSVLATLISDRPDKKFNDGIDSSDIIDLRCKISLSGLNYQKILEKNLHELFKGSLISNKIQSLCYDSISDSDIFGYNDILSNMGASGKRKYWSDALTTEAGIYAEVSTTTLSPALDVYRNSGIGSWSGGNTIIVKVVSKMPSASVIKATPKVYLEDKLKTEIVGTWSGLNTNQAVFTMSGTGAWVGTNYDIWVYYDVEIPANQGLKYVPDELLRVEYSNASSFVNGTVIRGTKIKNEYDRFQDVLEHPFENKTNLETFKEVSILPQRKQIKISPLVQTTSTKNGSTRTLAVETLDKVNKTIHVPYPLQHLRGVYTAATGGTELAMQQIVTKLQVSALEISENKILVSSDYLIGTLTSLQYTPSGAGSEIELLGYNYQGAPLSYVIEHRVVSGGTVGTRISLYNTNGVAWPIPVGANVSQFKWAGSRTRARQSSGYGYDLGGYIIDCTGSYNAAYISTMADRQQVWIDCDYFAAPHSGAELKMIYKYTPYQGSTIGNQQLKLVYKRERGVFFNNGTGGGTISLTGLGSANNNYTPLSARLPGSFEDHLRDGSSIEISSAGQKRYVSDIWMSACYDIYGFHGGCEIWPDDYVMPSTPESSQRGFLGSPMLEVIFEEPVINASHADFIMPILVRNKLNGQLYLMIQMGNEGVQVHDSSVFVDLFHLEERIIVKE